MPSRHFDAFVFNAAIRRMVVEDAVFRSAAFLILRLIHSWWVANTPPRWHFVCGLEGELGNRDGIIVWPLPLWVGFVMNHIETSKHLPSK